MALCLLVPYRIIYDKIDRNNDSSVTEAELVNWIKHVQNLYIYSDTERQWDDHSPKGSVLTWEEYQEKNYGLMDDGTYRMNVLHTE